MRWLPLLLFVAACEGPTGPAGTTGTTTLVSTSAEPAGANCADGGAKIEAGVDSNGNGVLDASEVTSTSYVCNGPGTTSLVATSVEPPGVNCPWGGTKLEEGVDANNNGVLDANEVNAAATQYVCAFGPPGALSPSTGIVAAVKAAGVTTSTTDPIAVRFTLKDDRGYPIDIAGVYSVNGPIQPRLGLAHFKTDSAGNVLPLIVYSKSGSPAQPTMYNPLTTSGAGTLVENGLGAGDYTYTFPSSTTTNGPVAVAYDTSALDDTHVVWIQASRQTDLVFTTNANTFYASNAPYYFVPSGNGTPGTREIAAQSGCNNCHNKFKAETVSSAQFHGGGRVDARMCNMCHNPGRTVNPAADSASFVHRIHNSEQVATANLFHNITITYPQDTRNCNACHAGAAQGNQALTHPTQIACQGCHDYVSFANAAPTTCGVSGTLARDSDGKPLPCNHFAGAQAECASCHGPSGAFPETKYHTPVASPDPNNLLNGGTNPNTNASFVAATGFIPAGADAITYDLKSVDAVADANNIKRPQVTFKLRRNGTDVVFQAYAAGSVTELMPGYVGSPSAYFAFAMPQDGNTAPSDFNASVSGYIKNIWNGSATGAGAGTLVGPDMAGYYKLTLTNVQIPPAATMLTGGIGYTYSLSGTPPLVQTNVVNYPYDTTTKQGGLSVPAPNVWKVATGYTGRRQIVDTAKCNACHGSLGVTPTFHAGQRNDGPTCSFCHNPNRTSAGWAAGSKYFIHAIHGARQRTVPYTWHAESAGVGFDEVEFPGTLNSCSTCHVAGSFDFTNPSNLAAFGSELLSTVATGKYDSNPQTNSTYFTVSPYVVSDGVTDYGAGFAYNAMTNTTTQAAGTTLVTSAMTGACSACHDSSADIDHMRQNGGLFYAPRSTALAPTAPPEQCLICHGPGRTAAIGIVHQH
ncbi:MAG: OmcA/MtrC family decaheme c-type cytochrome [Deltaproteobacteria bacterium]|nr:OmcA/MtrC family decaheme c-type cytochrome [Deltaproteobacteria bacterium]